MRSYLLGAVMLALPALAQAAGGAMALVPARPDVHDQPSLQNGAKVYMNYCLGCHALSYMRYTRVGKDIGLNDDQVKDNLVLTGAKVVDEIRNSLRADDAKRWFGVQPPDLSVVARSRGPDWLYSYLLTFYHDPNPARPFGVNNVVFPDVAMPHALHALQGVQRREAGVVPEGAKSVAPVGLEFDGADLLVVKQAVMPDGSHERFADRLVLESEGELSPGQYRKATRDLVNFLTYIGEPAQLDRYRLGMWVILFLIVLFVLSRALYKEYWRDVH
ncbi:MAG: cytochrome c1 [Ectothiorhodospiraceae bacterium]|nr:cytochrome c1 [Ectothiorhodospiraceae bacterium]